MSHNVINIHKLIVCRKFICFWFIWRVKSLSHKRADVS